MELATTLTAQTVQASIRSVGINPDHWYAVGWAKDWQPGQVKPVQIWEWTIAVYRDTNGQLHALENICPHRGVALHEGKVKGDRLACRYHGWEFTPTGECARVPYLLDNQKLPRACTRAYPVQEQYGLVWLFPGQADLAVNCDVMRMPEYTEPGWLMVPVSVHFKAHFSICNENTMDVFHGILHEDLQGWFDPVLEKLEATDTTVQAQYRVSYRGKLAKFLGLAQQADQVTTNAIAIAYCYPHYHSQMAGISALYLMRLPIGPCESRSFALFFFKTPLARWLPHWLQPLVRSLLQRFVLHRFIAQDKVMVESEQQTYQAHPQRRFVEINPAILAVQRLTLSQYERFANNRENS